MKKTFWKDLFKTILHSKVTFISILLFVMMGLGFFFGIDWSSSYVSKAAVKTFDENKMFDIQLNVSPGLKNPEELLNIEGVDEQEGLYTYITEFKDKSKGYEASFTSLPSKLNNLYDVEGKLPTEPGEIALVKYWAKDNGYKINDTICIKNEEIFLGIKRFSVDTFKVTALFESPIFMPQKTTVFGISPEKNVPVNASFYVHESSFNQTVNDAIGFNVVYMRSNELRNYDCFSDEYFSKLSNLKTKIENSPLLVDKTFTTTTIRDTMSHQNIQIIARVFNKLKYSMAALFVLVGFLISYFSISRMINENSVLVGVKKSLGFKSKEIHIFYFLYVGLAVLLGSILGFVFAKFAAQPVIVSAVTNSMSLIKIPYYSNLLGPLVFAISEIILQTLITFFANRRVLKRNAYELVKDEKVVVGKKRFYQKGRLWNKLSLFMKTLINNFVNEKQRVLSMLVGIGGCVSLLVCSLAIERNIVSSFDQQFNGIFNFQSVVFYDVEKGNENIQNILDENNFIYKDVMFTYLSLETPDEKKISAQAYVFEDNEVNEFITMYSTKDEIIEFEDGIYLSCSYKNEYDLDEISDIKLTDSSLKTVETKSKGYFKHYLINNIIFMNAETYKNTFDKEYKANTILVNLNGLTNDKLNELIYNDDSFIYVYDIYGTGLVTFNAITNIFKIVDIVYLVLSILLALLVVLDLLVMFIQEKKNELITLMINGYSRHQAKKYIYFDTIIISVIGIGLGLLLGTLMSNMSVKSFFNETMFFVTGFNLIGSLIAVSGAILIISVVTLLALNKINKFKLNDVNRLN